MLLQGGLGPLGGAAPSVSENHWGQGGLAQEVEAKASVSFCCGHIRWPSPPARWGLVFWNDWGSSFLGAGPLPEDGHHTLVPCIKGHVFCMLL